jgi:hypothetical protein
MLSIDPHDLEAAMPTLTDKLRELQVTLSEEEQGVFAEIIRSASDYTRENREQQMTGARYAKPISATATFKMKQHIIDLPSTLAQRK